MLPVVKINLKIIGFVLPLLLLMFLLVGSFISKPKFNLKNKFLSNLSLESRCPDCNIILIDIDLLRADSLPCYGYKLDTSPNICELAKTSIFFKDNYAQSTWTLPSAFSTATSLYPSFHKIENSFIDVLPANGPTTLAETLQNAGYQTALVGGNNNASFLATVNGGDRGFDHTQDTPLNELIPKLAKDPKPWFIHYYIGALHMPYVLEANEKPISELKNPGKIPTTELDFDRILNIYLKKHYREIFKPKTVEKYAKMILAPEQTDDISVTILFRKLFSESQTPDEYLFDYWRPIYLAYMEYFDTKSPEAREYVKMLYDSRITGVDLQIGNIINLLKQNNVDKKTIVVIMSDHGESFGEHGIFNHDPDHHTELFFTPLIVKLPNSSGIVFEKPSSNLDIFPTLVDLVNVNIPTGLQGISLLPYLNQQEELNRDFIMSENPLGEIILQNRDWLYYLPSNASQKGQDFLYHKQSDPTEAINVANQNPDLISKLYKQASLLQSYFKMNRSNSAKLLETPKIKLNSEKADRMKKEGYF